MFTGLLLVALLAMPAWADVALVRENMPASVIIIPKSPSYVSSRAAFEFQEYIEKISGAKIPIYTEDEIALEEDLHWLDRYMPIILIGPCERTKQMGIDIDSLPPEGFYIKTKNNALILTGKDVAKKKVARRAKWQDWRVPHQDRGTLWAVYTFLEDTLGVAWLWPGE